MDKHQRYQAVRNTSFLGALVNTVLGILKVSIGVTGHSHALLADGIHSFADLLTDALVIFAARWGSQDADDEHPYGHGRIETVASVALALLLSVVGVAIILDAIHAAFISIDTLIPSNMVLIMAAVSVVSNELLFQYTRHVAHKVQSDLLLANAWHHRSDAASSIVVLAGVAATKWLGFHFIDACAAIIVGMLIIKMGWDISWRGIQELIDTAVDSEDLIKIEQAIAAVPGVLELHQLRTRFIAQKIFLDVHILVEPRLTVSEGHHISDKVQTTLKNSFKQVEDVTVHVDHENDELFEPNMDLPDRHTVMALLQSRWQQLAYFDQISHINLHYLAGKIEVEVIINVSSIDAQQANAITHQLQSLLSSQADLRSVSCLFSLTKA